MNRRQELSRKIYEAGFKACNRRIGLNKSIAYFSVDWCWEMLPKKILYSEKYGYTSYLRIDQKGLHYGKEPYFEIKDSLHEALLETICWCIDNGHIKAVK